MNYGEILTKAWHIIWKNKVLWIFGILAGCSSSGGNGGSSYRGGDGTNGQFFGQDIQRFFESIPAWVWVTIVIAGVILALIAVLLVTVGRIGLIKGTVDADEGAAHLKFGQLFSASMPYFWRVLLLNLLLFVVAILAVVVLAVPVALLVAGLAVTIVGIICIIPLACVLGIVAWLFGIFIQQSTIALVTEDLGVMDALKRGWQVVTRNPGQYIVMGVILGIIGFVAALIIGLPLVALILPPLFNMAVSSGNQVNTGIAVSIVLFLLYLPVLLVLNGILQAYLNSAWTLTFRRLTRTGASPVDVFIPPAAPPVVPPVVPPAAPLVVPPVEPPAEPPASPYVEP